MTQDELWPLLARMLSHEASPDDHTRWQQWLNEHPDNRAFAERMQAVWTAAEPSRATSTEASEAFRHFQRRLPNRDHRPQPVPNPHGLRRRVGWLTGGIAGLLVLAVGITLWLNRTPVETPLVARQNPKGTRSIITLPDGSRIWLNADSRLKYPPRFTGNTRTVELAGEAFFDVAHNPKKPFIIRLASGTIRVLGTSFNVRAYPGDSTVETTVVTGKVAFVPKKPVERIDEATGSSPDTVLILPDRRVVQSLNTQQVKTLPTNPALQTGWRTDELVFRNTPLGEVAKTLERWYGIPVDVAEPELRQYPLTGTFRHQSIREVMDVIARTRAIQVEQRDDRYILTDTNP